MKDRIPPHNLDAERATLGACMLEKEVVGDIVTQLKKEDFYDEKHKEIFDAIVELYKKNSAIDILTVAEELKSRQALELAGGRAYIANITTEVISTVNAIDYSKIVQEKSMLRDLIKASETVTEKGYEQSVEPDLMLDFAEKSIFSIAKRNQKKEYVKLQDVLLKNLKTIDETSKNPDKLTGISTGFKKLDEISNGLQKSDLIIVAARPSMGKTAFALNVALQAALKADASVLIFSLEMSDEQLGMRLLSMQARIDSKKLSKGELEPNDWERLAFATDEMQKAKITIDATPGIRMMEMKNKCRRMKASNQGLDLIIVDYLQLMEAEGKSESRQQEVSKLSRQFKELAREMDCPVILLSQLNRAPDLRTDHRPSMADLRESGSIEQDADIIMLLYRDDFYNPETPKPGVCDIIVAKNRKGEIGSFELTWVSSFTKFSEQAF